MEIFKEIIKKSGLTQTEIAKRLDYTEANLSYLKNRKSAFIEKIKLAMNELGISEIEATEGNLHFTIKAEINEQQ
jgi:transcriptional regulator